MTKGKDTWDRLGVYLETMTDLTADTLKNLSSEWAGLWNAEDGQNIAESAFGSFRESVGLGIQASAKAWVATRDLMTDLAD
ncbi:MAG TPA: hypothetical protein VFP42_09680 [Acidimicrobiia bacterium]|nr:hypothetical protein [Acidimicrobiia bacterium]